MLKSTYRPPPPLPPGWTEHKAPSGHLYYYNAATKQSTYKRPTAAPVSTAQPIDPTLAQTSYTPENLPPFSSTPYGPTAGTAQSDRFTPNNTYQQYRTGHDSSRGHGNRRHREPSDRPKSKHSIPGCAPWLLVKTRYGRRFVHNPETKESYWRFPEHVLKGVVEFDRLEREKKQEVQIHDDKSQESPETGKQDEGEKKIQSQEASVEAAPDEADSDEYEEVEVTDDEEGEEQANKRPRVKDEQADADRPLEFNEEDIDYQLAAMGEDYGLDPGEYGEPGEEGWEEGVEGLSLTDEEATALFSDLLDDYHINPFTTWEKVLEEGRIINDTRYTVLSNMKARREAFASWSRQRIQEIKARKEKEEKKDPRIKYIAFLQEYATPKLYWPEFKRKYRKEDEMKNTKMSDKDREKLYRDHIARLKLSESTRKSDLSALLKSIPPRDLNNSTNIEALPPAVLTDLRYISLPPKIRDPLIEAYISTLPPAPEEETSALSAQEQREREQKRLERDRRENALAERERRVEEEKRRLKGGLIHGKKLLEQEAAEIQEAMQIRGKDGLRSYFKTGEDEAMTNTDQ
ncbi:FF domain protein [Talaromyces stipitatus ATCC 10500]|uniref:FF domain protein n=1 Tax=Talaromyces stipitatus (strain ATCC 10500 / CBS 375.48 / QM 6759 / NRRL 1006) TaxID=441959 RepID=B8LYQ6_TALSN|nr:FF domain protein [Talaromyces stipitatus ATCC 10500]EED23415.1 FF domain protein [Talaromyces stipitatus ATCC 10500]